VSTINARGSLALPTEGRKSRLARYAAIALGVAALGILSSWTHHAIEGSLKEMRAASLGSILDAEVRALEVWVAEKQLATRRLARDSRLRERVAALLRSDAGCLSLEAAGLREPLDPFLQDETVAAFLVLEPRGRPIAARPDSTCNSAKAAESMRRDVTLALAGQTRFLRPSRGAEGSPSVLWFITPVLGADARPIAVLALGKFADGRFGSIFSAARIGRTGEVYAFDERARMISGSRFAPVPRASDPLLATRLTQEALAGDADAARRGVLLEPYENDRGERVIGAWRWLPESGIGVAVEMAADEAYAPLAVLNAAFSLIFGALVAGLTASLLYVLWLKRQIGEVHRLGAYVLERKIGTGGMANVYLAHHALLRRPTAVKILKPEHSAGPQFIARFEREVKLASQLTHPNTVEIYDYGRTADGQFYYAMEYLQGIELLKLVKDGGPTPIGRAVYLLRQVCAGLAEAHAKGLVHRDIKPENIMVCVHGGEFDVVKILDFGLVKNVAEPNTRDLTRALKILGTPLYMAPERFRSPGDVDARADIYAVGAVAFFMLTGRDVFESTDDLELANRVLNDEAPRPTSAASQPIPIELDLLVTACLEKRREDRPQRVTDLIEALDALALRFRWSQRDAAHWWAAHPERGSSTTTAL
jgi:eukaryotic-like serine/threonine-protein kinase